MQKDEKEWTGKWNDDEFDKWQLSDKVILKKMGFLLNE